MLRAGALALPILALVASSCSRFEAAPSESEGGVTSSTSDSGSDSGSDGSSRTITCSGKELYCETFDVRDTIADLEGGPVNASGNMGDMFLTATKGRPERGLRISPSSRPSYYESRVLFEQGTIPTLPFSLRFDVTVGMGHGYEIGGLELERTGDDTLFVKLTVDASRTLRSMAYGQDDVELAVLSEGPHTIVIEVAATGKITLRFDGQMRGGQTLALPTAVTKFRAYYGLVGNGASKPGEFDYDNVALTVP